MNTGIYYLYEYKNNQKIRNTGFIKVLMQEHICSLQIHARSIPVSEKDTVILSAFYLENELVNAKEFAHISCQDHMIAEKTTLSGLPFPDQDSLLQIDGFFLVLPNGEVLAATASASSFDTRKIVCLSSEDSGSASAQEVSEQEVSEQPFSELPESASAQETSDCTKTETPVLASCSENIRKIQRSDLSCLPRRYWHIANNSFLLHGYYNYNHLLLVEEDGHYRLGVPGIYDPKEARAAGLFGFPEFTDSYNQYLTFMENECNDYGRFGYWCRYFK